MAGYAARDREIRTGEDVENWTPEARYSSFPGMGADLLLSTSTMKRM